MRALAIFHRRFSLNCTCLVAKFNYPLLQPSMGVKVPCARACTWALINRRILPKLVYVCEEQVSDLATQLATRDYIVVYAWTQNPPWTDRDLYTVLHCAYLVSYIIGHAYD